MQRLGTFKIPKDLKLYSWLKNYSGFAGPSKLSIPPRHKFNYEEEQNSIKNVYIYTYIVFSN